MCFTRTPTALVDGGALPLMPAEMYLAAAPFAKGSSNTNTNGDLDNVLANASGVPDDLFMSLASLDDFSALLAGNAGVQVADFFPAQPQQQQMQQQQMQQPLDFFTAACPLLSTQLPAQACYFVPQQSQSLPLAMSDLPRVFSAASPHSDHLGYVSSPVSSNSSSAGGSPAAHHDPLAALDAMQHQQQQQQPSLLATDDCTPGSDDLFDDDDEYVESPRPAKRSSSHAGSSGRKRKHVADMAPDELAAYRAKGRIVARRNRARRKAAYQQRMAASDDLGRTNVALAHERDSLAALRQQLCQQAAALLAAN